MKKKFKKKIFICATEQSGDNIGQAILKDIKSRENIKIDGIGGSKMKPFMNNQLYSLKDFKSIGIFEILFSLFKYIKIINQLSKLIIKNNYDLIITIDSPDFNYPLVKKIKKLGYIKKTLHIVAPTVWAWRGYRAKKFAEIYDEMFTLFSFENKYFEKFNIKMTFIGHPIYYIKNNSLKEKNNIVFMPGSRLGEVKSLFKYFNLAYQKLLIHQHKLTIFIPTLPHLEKNIKYRTKNWKIKTIVTSDTNLIEKNFRRTKLALVCSGTASLEIAKRNIPQLVIYKLNYLTEFIASFFVKVKYANIINIIEKKMIIPEITNSKLNNIKFLKNFDKLLNNDKLNSLQIKEVKKSIKKISRSKPPFKIASSRIKKIL